jgi:hypothetical protein
MQMAITMTELEWKDRKKVKKLWTIPIDSAKFAKMVSAQLGISTSEYITSLIDADWDEVTQEAWVQELLKKP